MNDSIKKARNIYLAHGDSGQRSILLAILKSLDHEVSQVTDSGIELIDQSLAAPPDLIIASPRLSDMDGIEAMIRISEEIPTAGIVIARSDDLDKVERAMEDHVMAYLVEPVTAETLQPAIYLAERRFEHFQSLIRKISRLEGKLEDRKIIEQAKGIVMQVRGITEHEAHRFLQTTATKQRQKIAELAKTICEAGDILQP